MVIEEKFNEYIKNHPGERVSTNEILTTDGITVSLRKNSIELSKRIHNDSRIGYDIFVSENSDDIDKSLYLNLENEDGRFCYANSVDDLVNIFRKEVSVVDS